jgi:hypothetical protein
MPEPPDGEAQLRALTRRFETAERRVRGLLAKAPAGDRRELLAEALAILHALRREDARGPVVAAYLAAFRAVKRGGKAESARDLAGSLALKLDRGAQTASTSARQTFSTVSADDLDKALAAVTTAHVDRRGTRWPLGAWAAMNATTIGRQASTRGLIDAVGHGRKVVVEASGCPYCETFAGEAIVGENPLPPFHPSCTCTASAT